MNKRQKKKKGNKKLARETIISFFKEKLLTIDFSKFSYEDIIAINEKKHTKDSFQETIFYKKLQDLQKKG